MTDTQPSIEEADWINADSPPEGQLVQVRAQDDHGFYILPFVVVFRDDDWWNARTEERLECYIAAWRPLNG